ncbi:GNAT family N-acetyltransferase [Falsirhodobacter sp. alg1]|uniref:GNAT family N-acetyltransferase n=1 Tax=Falsirhodobacter sp. alg1 TaxID=1472418 RepID=UPI000788A491|nr:GNAT family N-acetyltransferase [Falsirhodobacter sp. alg1]
MTTCLLEAMEPTWPPLRAWREGEWTMRDGGGGGGRVSAVTLYEAAVADIAGPSDAVAEWPPSAATVEMWAEQGKIGPERLAVMERAADPKTVISMPGGAGFLGVNGDLAVLHALEVSPAHRRQGRAREIIRGAALWAVVRGATRFALVVSDDNPIAHALYKGLGMRVAGHYHYRRVAG